ncbi:DNA modification methyltransferase [Herbaspirillum sp. DW155]|uniref:DNA modification methylase n=1 Tax=Herbaspirillum sp. DW155 TaxID=3095609 RepID=UPI003089C9E0|nr:DNA modification methyltransferase [Herbaspirillum sp. DW155]
MQTPYQDDLFGASPVDGGKSVEQRANEQSGTFTPNMKLPIHRWFRYSAGFSSDWVRSVIQQYNPVAVLDPFVGSGTVCVEADIAGVPSFGVESHPFVFRLAHGKLAWSTSIEEFRSAIAEVEKRAALSSLELPPKVPDLLVKCYEPQVLLELLKLRQAAIDVSPELAIGARSLLFLAINSILRPTSHVGTAQWQYVLPNKRKATVTMPAEALTAQSLIMAEDMAKVRSERSASIATLLQGDARQLAGVPDQSVDLVVTSPPYANNYDYADATRLEMTFWGEIDSWGDLHGAVRKFLICSSSQHASKEKLKLDELLARPSLAPIRDEISKVCNELAVVRMTKGGSKHYHTMIAAYYSDMGETLKALRRVTKSGSNMCLVIGDSAPYGVHAPAEKWLGAQAIACGFSEWSFEKIRERNVKWKNRKHDVPLHEGRLWIRG